MPLTPPTHGEEEEGVYAYRSVLEARMASFGITAPVDSVKKFLLAVGLTPDQLAALSQPA